MAYRVDVTARAVRDLRNIYRTIDAEGSEQARAWLAGLEVAILSLEEMPNRCPPTQENNALRHYLYGDKPHVYRIVYDIDEAHRIVRVLFIRHGARKPLPEPRG